MTIQNIHDLFLKCSKVSIDTRKIEPNSFFVAIKGERFDANTFAKEAYIQEYFHMFYECSKPDWLYGSVGINVLQC